MDKNKIINEILSNSNSDALILISDQNRYWISDFRSSAGFAICMKDKIFLLLDGRYYEMAKAEIKNNKIELILYTSFNQIKEIFNDYNINSIVVEGDYMNVNEYNTFKNLVNDIKVIDSKKLRISKNYNEIISMKKAVDITIKAMDWLMENIKPGMSEKEVANLSISKMLEFGAEKQSFDTIVASGENGAYPHHKPTNRVIQEGEFITIDMGCIYNGYCSDMTRTFSIGELKNQKLKEAYEVVLKANQRGIEMAKVGITGAELDSYVREVIDNTEFKEYFVHSTGHGVGIDVHEYPNVAKSYKNKILNGSVITIEPGIYIPDVGGIRIEDMVYVSDTGNELLTKDSKK